MKNNSLPRASRMESADGPAWARDSNRRDKWALSRAPGSAPALLDDGDGVLPEQ